ncbi:hypothetical protein H4Q26_017898 [Puccinia striiformis f. sp. tritici PST-130]|nr:hypothetical protein H4Q26_017898 [Puccinia striiformis f. sp. tritici PST-130]
MIASMMHNHSRPPPSFNSTTSIKKVGFIHKNNNVHPSQTANFPPVFGILEGDQEFTVEEPQGLENNMMIFDDMIVMTKMIIRIEMLVKGVLTFEVRSSLYGSGTLGVTTEVAVWSVFTERKILVSLGPVHVDIKEFGNTTYKTFLCNSLINDHPHN